MTSVISVAACAAAAILACAPVLGATGLDDREAVPRRVVHVQDLDLATRGGQRIALARLSAAATRVCEPQEAGGIFAVMRCRRDSIARAKRDLAEYTQLQAGNSAAPSDAVAGTPWNSAPDNTPRAMQSR